MTGPRGDVAVKLQVWLPPDTARALSEYAGQLYVSRSWLIKLAVDGMLAQIEASPDAMIEAIRLDMMRRRGDLSDEKNQADG